MFSFEIPSPIQIVMVWKNCKSFKCIVSYIFSRNHFKSYQVGFSAVYVETDVLVRCRYHAQYLPNIMRVQVKCLNSLTKSVIMPSEVDMISNI